MRRLGSGPAAAFLLAALLGCPHGGEAPPAAPRAEATAGPLAYPEARRGDTVDTYFGVEVADPYRWLEDPYSEETRAWVEAENAVTERWLADVEGRDAIHARLEEVWNYERWGLPFKKGGHYFWTHNDGLQDHSVVFTAASLDGEARVLFDPNEWSEDGTVALGGWSVSEDGRYAAYAVADAGSDWQTWRIRDIESGRDLDDELRWVKFSGANWDAGSQGFYYGRYPEPTREPEDVNLDNKLYYHAVGTPQSADVLVYERTDEPEWAFAGSVTEDGSTLAIHVWQGTEEKSRFYYRPADDPEAPVVKLLDDFDAQYSLVGNVGRNFFFFTNQAAPRGRVIAIDLDHPERDRWIEVVAQGEATIENVSLVGGRLVVQQLEDAHSVVRVHDLDGALLRSVELPGLGSSFGFAGRADDGETFYAYTSYTFPTTIYRYDVQTGEGWLWKTPAVDFDTRDYVTEQVFYTSADGTRIPMYLTFRKDLRRDGSNPALLYGYGGFNISITPSFSMSNLVWMEMGGVFAVANLRGGGEYGQEWHEAGTKRNKQNVFDDFVAGAEYLVAEGWTRPEKLAISGRSNGGLLIGAVITQRPELFGAALPGVGVMDMLRYHRFTIGWAWASDYGTSEDDAEMFAYLYGYSPVHNAREGTSFPATMITTADHDDRVVPAHSYKFAAAAQHASAGPDPVLIRVETRAGHGGGMPTSMKLDLVADEWAFLARALGMQVPYGTE